MSFTPENYPYRPDYNPVSQEAITGSYELHVALLVNEGIDNDVALQQVVEMHQQSSEAFEWYAGQIDAYRSESFRRSNSSAEEFTHEWVTRINQQPSDIIREVEVWRSRGRNSTSEMSYEQRQELESIFIDEAIEQYAQFSTSLLQQRGLQTENAHFLVSMQRAFRSEHFINQCLDFAVYRSEIIDRMARNGDTLASATEAWNEWVLSDPETVQDCASDWLWAEKPQLSQSLAPPSN